MEIKQLQREIDEYSRQIGQLRREVKIINLKNKKVKIKHGQILSRKQDLSQKYTDFINENKNTIFTVKKDKKHPDGVLYTFKENDLWLFHENDLEIVKKKGEYHDKSRKENKNVGTN